LHLLGSVRSDWPKPHDAITQSFLIFKVYHYPMRRERVNPLRGVSVR
jgi:hypothetical protein